jgi:hypothetical protein
MGTTSLSYISAWIVFYLINGILLSIVFIAQLAIIGVFDNTGLDFGTAIGLYLLYMLASLSFVLFLSTFFEDATLASQIITFTQLLGSMLYFLLFVQAFRKSLTAMQVTALLPTVCFEYILMNIGLSKDAGFKTPFSSDQGFITLGCLAVGYFILFTYLSLVLPN